MLRSRRRTEVDPNIFSTASVVIKKGHFHLKGTPTSHGCSKMRFHFRKVMCEGHRTTSPINKLVQNVVGNTSPGLLTIQKSTVQCQQHQAAKPDKTSEYKIFFPVTSPQVSHQRHKKSFSTVLPLEPIPSLSVESDFFSTASRLSRCLLRKVWKPTQCAPSLASCTGESMSILLTLS